MPLTVTCSSCGHEYQVRDDNAGKKFRCRKCDAVVTAPSRKASSRRPADEDDDDSDDYEDYHPANHKPARRRTGSSGNSVPVGKVVAVIAAVSFVGLVLTAFIIPAVQQVRRINEQQLALQPPDKIDALSPAGAGWSMKLVKEPTPEGGITPTPEVAGVWNLTTANGRTYTIRRSARLDVQDKQSIATIQELELGSASVRDELSKRSITISAERMSVLGGAPAIEIEFGVGNPGRARRTRIGEYEWSVTIGNRPESANLSDWEYDAFFNSFQVVDFAKPVGRNLTEPPVISPTDSGFEMMFSGTIEAKKRRISDEDHCEWSLLKLDGITIYVHRNPVDARTWTTLGYGPLPNDKEINVDVNEFTAMRDKADPQNVLVSRKLSELSGVIAKEEIHDRAAYESVGTMIPAMRTRSRNTRIGKFHWSVSLTHRIGTNEPTEDICKKYFDSFRIVGFARPPELDEALNNRLGTEPVGKSRVRSQDFLTARRAHKTILTKTGPAPQEFERETPPAGVRQVSSQSGNLQLAAWFAVPPGKENSKSPVCVFFHGGHAFGAGDFEVCRPLLNAGFAVMTPMLRGENGNPGSFELFFGELDDAVGAVRWVAQQPEIDATKIFTFGHSIGGGVSALVSLAERDVPVLLSGSSGGLYDPIVLKQWADTNPFNANDPVESSLRLLVGNQRDMQRRHVAYVGSSDTSIARVAKQAAAEADHKGLLEIVTISGDHFSSFEPALNAFLVRMENEVRLSGVPGGSTASLPGQFNSTGSSTTKDDPTAKKGDKDPYFKAPTRFAAQQPAAVGLVRGFAMSDASHTWMALSGDKGTVQIINTKDGDIYRSAKLEGGPEAVAFSGNGKFLAISTGAGKLRLYDIQQRTFVMNESSPGGGVLSIAPSDSENGFVVASKSNSLFGFSAPQRKGDPITIATIAKCDDRITGMKLVTPENKRVAITSGDGMLRLLDARQRKFTHEFSLKSGELTAVSTTHDGRHAVVGSRKGTMLVDLGSGAVVKTLYSEPLATAVACGPLSDKGISLTAIGHENGRVLIVNGATGDADSACLMGSSAAVRHLNFSTDGKGLAAMTDKDAMLFLWDLTKAPDARKEPSSTLGFPVPFR